MANALTPRQLQTLQEVEAFLSAHNYPPTRAELAQLMGLASPNAAQEHLEALDKKGYIKLTPNTARGIRLLRCSS
ncbi:hypothetical protein 9F2_45 [uncultured Caudovirales phage]|uniref:LexA repressor DNA-binding domain-containing protein n=1 Tax=uncultured Caudovirales phage TaxID=2100421 RepID=A0A2H4JG58_9CAUD|nr:hypothetical protein 9F2_45 [uncultured Caudovirales phage]